MQERRQQKPMEVTEYANSLIMDMKSLSNALKPVSKNIYENNNRILNDLLSVRESDSNDMVIKVLAHTLQIAQYKLLLAHTLSILNKTIIYVKTIKWHSSSPAQQQQLMAILGCIIDVLVAISTQHRDLQETSLRVLQTAFSLIDHCLVSSFSASMVTRMLSIFLQFSGSTSIVQNISVSALFALMESLFQFGTITQSFQILDCFLQYLFDAKKFLWIRGKELKGLIWDLTVICVKNFTANHIIGLQHQPQVQKLLSNMYDVVLQNIFMKKNKNLYNPPVLSQKQTNQKDQASYTDVADFLRFFKAFVAFSSSLSIQSCRVIEKQFLGFRATIPKLVMVCDLERNSRMLIFLEAICQLLLDQYDMPLSLEKGCIFMEILCKVSQQLCWCNELGLKVNWDYNDSYLYKVGNQEPRIGDGDFVRLIKNTLVQLRMKFQKDEDLLKSKKGMKEEKESARSITLPNNMGNSKRWQVFIKNVVRIVRYLSSLNFITEETEQDPTRKIILELQYWFLICPTSKAKNIVLQELLITANVLNNKMQAIKVSQSVQIGSNILYGYYEDLDSMGLTIILKMMAGIKVDWEEGKSFEELDEVYNLVCLIFTEEKLIKSEASFIMTIQALVQCTSSLIADIEEPKQKQPSLQIQNSIKRSHKMIDFLLQKLIVVISNNLALAAQQWNFITGFLITLFINKNQKIKEEGIKCIGALVSRLLKSELGKEIDEKKEVDIMGLYEELAKSKNHSKEIELSLIEQLKMIMPRVKQQSALMDGFRIVKILSEGRSGEVMGSIHELQDIMIKECLFRITDIKYLRLIVDGMQIKASEKNEEYQLINLLWSTADYFCKITPTQSIPNEYIQLWEAVFKSMWLICESSRECETKQSAIHSATQILAEVLSLLPFDFIMLVIDKYYEQMVLLLLGVHPSAIADSEKSSQTAKVALKNYIKIFKKLISVEGTGGEGKKQIATNFSKINRSITKFIEAHVEKKSSGAITLELLYQLCNFILAVREDSGFEEYGVHQQMRRMFESIQELVKVSEQQLEAGQANPKMDLKSHMYKKKLKPLIDRIRELHDKEKKEEVVVEDKIRLAE